MFHIRWKPRVDVSPPPDALEWWERSLDRSDPAELTVRLTEQLRFAIARAESCERPVFLRALGRDLENELEDLSARIAFSTGESGLELTRRRELLEELVDYYCESMTPWTQVQRAVELSDCVREAVAGLSADMVLVLRVQGEPVVAAARRRLISLCELTIRAAAVGAEDEVEVVVPPCSDDHAELRVQWAPASLSLRESHDKAIFLALAIAYIARLGGTLRRASDGREGLVLRIPLSQRSTDGVSATPSFDSDVVTQATAFCLEG